MAFIHSIAPLATVAYPRGFKRGSALRRTVHGLTPSDGRNLHLRRRIWGSALVPFGTQSRYSASTRLPALLDDLRSRVAAMSHYEANLTKRSPPFRSLISYCPQLGKQGFSRSAHVPCCALVQGKRDIKEERRLPTLVDKKANALPDADTALPKHRSLSSYVLVPGQFPDPLKRRQRFGSNEKRKEKKSNC